MTKVNNGDLIITILNEAVKACNKEVALSVNNLFHAMQLNNIHCTRYSVEEMVDFTSYLARGIEQGVNQIKLLDEINKVSTYPEKSSSYYDISKLVVF